MSRPSEISPELKDSNKIVRTTIEVKGKVRYRLFQLGIRNNLPMGEIIEGLLNLFDEHPELGSYFMEQRQRARQVRRTTRQVNKKAIENATNDQLIRIDQILKGGGDKEFAP